MTKQEIKVLLNQAFHLGQLYWQQADSDYTSQHRKSEETRDKFKKLVEDGMAKLEDA